MKVAVLTTDNRQHYKDFGAPAPYFGIAVEALLQGMADLPDVEVHVISSVQARTSSPAQLGPNTFFHSLYVPKIGWMRTFYLGCVLMHRKKLRQIHPQIVHGQGTERDCAISAVMSGFPNVVTIHGNMAELARLFRARPGSFHWLAARLENLTLKRTAGVFCNSQYTENLVRPRTPRTWRVPNALRESFFSAPQAVAQTGKCILLNVGEISPRKRQLELLAVAQQLDEQGLACEFHFIGNCPKGDRYGAAFLEKIKPMQDKGLARYLGMKTTDELIRCFDEASALVHFPSEESFGLVVAEALARNLKLFGSRLGGLLDIASGIAEAELFEAKDWQGLRDGISAWLKSGHPRATNASAAMRSRYHPSVIARRHLEIYQEVLSKPA